MSTTEPLEADLLLPPYRSLHRPHDNHVPIPGCVLDLATYFLNPTGSQPPGRETASV